MGTMPDGDNWRLVRTPNPAERSLVVTANMSEIARVNQSMDAYREGSAFKDFPLVPQAALASEQQYGNYTFKDCLEAGPRTLDFLFVKKKTPEERNRQFSPTKKVTERVPWPAELHWIQFAIASGFPLSQQTINTQGEPALVTADRWLAPRGFRNRQELYTTVEIREFLSDESWPDFAMECDEPQPTEVMWDLVGHSGTMGPCLHEPVEVPAQTGASYRVVSQAGDLQAANATGSKTWLFPRTNHLRRQDYVINIIQYTNGQFYRQEKTYINPTGSKLIRQS